MGGTADKRVRVRVFSYLRSAGIDVSQANHVASKVVGAMVGSGKLPESAIAIAAAAVTANSKLDGMNEQTAGVLVEPKAEPYEVGGASTGKPLGGPGGGKSLAGFEIGGLPCRDIGKPSGGFGKTAGAGYKNPVAAGGSRTNFAIIEPIMTRREVQARMGEVLSRGQIQSLVGAVLREIR